MSYESYTYIPSNKISKYIHTIICNVGSCIRSMYSGLGLVDSGILEELNIRGAFAEICIEFCKICIRLQNRRYKYMYESVFIDMNRSLKYKYQFLIILIISV